MTIRTLTLSPGTVVSDDANGGTVAWLDPEGAKAEGGDAANATGPGISEWLECSGYDLSAVLSTARPLTVSFPLRRRNGDASVSPSVAAVGVVAQASSLGNSTVSGSINAPSGTVDGDLLLAIVVASGIDASVAITSVPNGWALVRGSLLSTSAVAVYSKPADSDGDSGSWGVTSPTPGVGMRGRILRLANHATASAIDASTPMNVTGPGTAHEAHEVTTTVDGCLVLSIFASYGGATFSTPGGTSEEADQNGMAVFSAPQAVAGATGNKASTSSGSATVGALQIAIKPEAQTVTDVAAHRVVGGVIDTDTNYALGAAWADAYQADTIGPIDISDLDISDLDGDLGLALSVEIEGGGRADLDHAPLILAVEVDVDVDVTSHTDEGTLERPNAVLAWDASVAGVPIIQATYRVQGRKAGVLIYDSGVVVTATQEHEIGSGTPVLPWAAPTNGEEIEWTVIVTEDGTADPASVGDPITGSLTLTLTNDWAQPPAPTGLAVTFVTTEEEGS